MSTWLEAITGTLVSCETSTGCSFTPKSLAYSCASIQAGPAQGSPARVVSSTSHGGFDSTPTRSTPALRMASTRALTPGRAGRAGLGDGSGEARGGKARGGKAREADRGGDRHAAEAHFHWCVSLLRSETGPGG